MQIPAPDLAGPVLRPLTTSVALSCVLPSFSTPIFNWMSLKLDVQPQQFQEIGNIYFPLYGDLAPYAVCYKGRGNMLLTHLQHGAHHKAGTIPGAVGCFQACADVGAVLPWRRAFCFSLLHFTRFVLAHSSSFSRSQCAKQFSSIKKWAIFYWGCWNHLSHPHEDVPAWQSESKKTILLGLEKKDHKQEWS